MTNDPYFGFGDEFPHMESIEARKAPEPTGDDRGTCNFEEWWEKDQIVIGAFHDDPKAVAELAWLAARAAPEPKAPEDIEVDTQNEAKQRVLEIYPHAFHNATDAHFANQTWPAGIYSHSNAGKYLGANWQDAANKLTPILPEGAAFSVSMKLTPTAIAEPAKCKLCGDTFLEHYSLGNRKICYNKDPQKTAFITGNYFTPSEETNE